MERYNTHILKDPIVINAETDAAVNIMIQPLMNSVAANPVAANPVTANVDENIAVDEEEIDAEEAIKSLNELDANNNTLEFKLPTRVWMLNTLINVVLVLLLIVLVLHLVYDGKCFPKNLFKK